jgi:hypothetical protein
MLGPTVVFKQIEKITAKLIEIGLSAQQNFPSNKDGYVAYTGMQDVSIAMKNIAYEEIYKRLDQSKNYNIKMLDGALIQMLYSYDNNKLASHRLAFFPAPNLESFQNEPEFYENDEIYADILRKNIVTFPIRFDYDPCKFQEIEHPQSHVTLGQYKNCRIPVSEPLTPEMFITFLLQSFYNTAYRKYTRDFTVTDHRFDKTITNKEKSVLHFGVY